MIGQEPEKKSQWAKIVYVKQSLLSTFCIGSGQFKYIRKTFNHQINFDVYQYVDGAICYSAPRLEKAKMIVSPKPLEIIPDLHTKLIKVCGEYLRYGQKYSRQDYQKKDNEELKEDFRNFIQAYEKILACLWVPIVVDPVITRLLEQKLKNKIEPEKSPQKYQQTFLTFTASVRETELLKAKRDILKIAIEIKKDAGLTKSLSGTASKLQKTNPYLNKRIIKYLADYKWLETSFLVGTYKTYNSVIKELKSLIKNNPSEKLKEIEAKKKAERKNLNQTLKEIEPDRQFLKIINLAQEIVFLRTYRLEAINKGTANFEPLLKELANRFKIKLEDLVMLFPKEIIALLAGRKIDYSQKIKERKKGYGCLVAKGKARLFLGKSLEKLKQQETLKIGRASEIKGQVAYPGKVKGRVKLVLGKNNVNKISRGDILVTKMTTPDFVVAMEKAGAVVTDIGGITSHAAIISRELGKPCIIGTKIATQVLKDGDRVEVDANKGVIKKL